MPDNISAICAVLCAIWQPAPRNAPSLEEVRERIEQRYAVAIGQAELAGSGTAGRVAQVQRAVQNQAVRNRLAEIQASVAASDQQTSVTASSQPREALPASGPQAIDAPGQTVGLTKQQQPAADQQER